MKKLWKKVRNFFVKRLYKENGWNGPTCSCSEFFSIGKCKHLQIFDKSSGSSVECKSLTSSSQCKIYKSVPCKSKNTLSHTIFDDSNRAIISVSTDENYIPDNTNFNSLSKFVSIQNSNTDSIKNYETVRHGLENNNESCCKTSLYFKDSNRNFSSDDFNKSFEHIKNNIEVPERIVKLNQKVKNIDFLFQGTCGRAFYRSELNSFDQKQKIDSTIVLTKVLRCKAPSCLPHHQTILNNELEILSKLKPHPNICQYFGYTEEYEENNTLRRMLVYEFINESLLDRMKHRNTQKNNNFTISEAQKYTSEIAKAIEYLHSLNIMHRDINSDNVLLSIVDGSPSKSYLVDNSFNNTLAFNNKGSVNKTNSCLIEPFYVAKLSNFEVAKHCNMNQKCKTWVSTPTVMSPEIWGNQTYSFSADVWAFGIVLYDIIFLGENPLFACNFNQIEKMVLGKKFPEKKLKLSCQSYKGLESIMRYCLQYKPENRPKISEVISLLEFSNL